MQRADVLVREAVGRVELEGPRENAHRVGGAAGLTVGDAQRVQRFGVVLWQRLEQRDGACRGAGLGQVGAELHEDVALLHAVA